MTFVPRQRAARPTSKQTATGRKQQRRDIGVKRPRTAAGSDQSTTSTDMDWQQKRGKERTTRQTKTKKRKVGRRATGALSGLSPTKRSGKPIPMEAVKHAMKLNPNLTARAQLRALIEEYRVSVELLKPCCRC